VQPGNSVFTLDQVVCASCFDDANVRDQGHSPAKENL
jgi:hypothetical protein